jgi:hypothetical protein
VNAFEQADARLEPRGLDELDERGRSQGARGQQLHRAGRSRGGGAICTDYTRSISRCDVLQRQWETRRPADHGSRWQPRSRHRSASDAGGIERAEDHVFKLATSLGLTPDGYRRVKPKMGRRANRAATYRERRVRATT